MPVAFVATLLFVLAGTSAQRHLGIPLAAVSAVLFVLGASLYLASVRLNRRYLLRRAGSLRRSGGPPGDFSAPAVPRWVVELSNVGFGAALAGILPLAASIAP